MFLRIRGISYCILIIEPKGKGPAEKDGSILHDYCGKYEEKVLYTSFLILYQSFPEFFPLR